MGTCRVCHAPIDLTGHFGRPPVYCSDEHRRQGISAYHRGLRSRRDGEVAQLRAKVARYESAAIAA